MANPLRWIAALLRLGAERAHDARREHARSGEHPHELDEQDRTLAQPRTGAAGADPLEPHSAERGGEHGPGGRTGGRDDADRGPAASRASHYVETRLGILTSGELAPYLARNVLALEARVERGELGGAPLTDLVLLDFHHVICGDVVPQLAGWRRTNDPIDGYTPPDHAEVPALVQSYMHELEQRIAAGSTCDDALLETLAYAEGRLLAIRPFADFNGRVACVWLREILRRLDLPPVRIAAVEPGQRDEHLRALRAADRGEWRPLMDVWKNRFEAFPI
jgi:cell filamentation protein